MILVERKGFFEVVQSLLFLLCLVLLLTLTLNCLARILSAA